MNLPYKQQRHGAGRGAAENNRGISATHQFYRAACAPSSKPLDALLSRLEGVRRSGNGWIARCPSHEDRSASLSVSEGEDGRVLLHDFAGCSASDIVAALGLELADLFPARLKDYSPEGRRAARQFAIQAGWAAALGVLAREATIIAIAAESIRRGEELASEDVDRVHVAANRIADCREVLRA